jgi:hypothetical protein
MINWIITFLISMVIFNFISKKDWKKSFYFALWVTIISFVMVAFVLTTLFAALLTSSETIAGLSIITAFAILLVPTIIARFVYRLKWIQGFKIAGLILISNIIISMVGLI